MAMKLRPDFLIQKRIHEDNKNARAAEYAQKLRSISQNTQWFESKTKYEFTDGEKRSQAYIKQEMQCANLELKTRRSTRLRMLYENEARAYEEELAAMGLAVQRAHL